MSAETKRWQEAASELSPAKSLDRMMTNGRFVLATIATVGVLLTGFGLVGVDRLVQQPLPRALGAASVPCALVAVILALYPLIARQKKVNLDNLSEVQAFYERGLRRAPLLTTAGFALGAALLLAGAAGSWAALASVASSDPKVTLVVSARNVASAKPEIRIIAKVVEATSDARVTLEVVSNPLNGPQRLLFRSMARVTEASGELAWDEVLVGNPGGATYVATIRIGRSTVTESVTVP